MKWLEQTHDARFELVRHFLARMLDGEWSSTRGQWQNVGIGVLTLALPASMLMMRSGSLSQSKLRLLANLADPAPLRAAHMANELALLTLLFTVMGLVALIQWQNFFPTRRDYLALAGLPVRSSQIFLARFAAVLLFSSTLVVAMNLLPSLTAPHRTAQAAATGLGCFFVLFAIVALQGVMLNLLSANLFARVSSYVQGALIGILILTGLYSWAIRDWPQPLIEKLPVFGTWLPPVWFAGLYQQLSGNADPFLQRMAARGLIAIGAAAALTLVSYVVSYRRYRKLLLEAPVHLEVPSRRQWSLFRLIAANPQQEAVMQFMAKTLTRSRAHRLIWLAYVAAAVGVMLNSSLIDGAMLARSREWSKILKFMLLFWPLGVSVVLLSGLHHVLRVPSELAANWIFRSTESLGRKEWMSAVERFVMLYGVAPIYVLLFPLAVYMLGWPVACRMTVQQVLVSLTIFDVLFNDWQQLPFTCSYTPGKRPLSMLVATWFFVLAMLVPLMALMIRALSEFMSVFLIYFPAFAAIWIWAHRRRRQGWGESKILYEDIPGDMPNLGIRELTWHAESH